MMRKFLALAGAVGGLALGIAVQAKTVTPAAVGGAPAATPPPPAAAAPPPAAAAGAGRVAEVPAKGPAIVVETGKGLLIRLPRPASTVFIANPAVADVQVKTPSLIYLTAKAPGETALYAVDAEDRVLLNAPVRVQHNLSQLRQSIGAIAPGQDVKVSSVGKAVVLNGTVTTADEAAKVSHLANLIAKEAKDGTVTNRLSVATPNQVNIRVKVAEVDREALKALGINWNRVGRHLLIGGTGTTNIVTINPLTGATINTSVPITGNPVTGGDITSQNELLAFIGGANDQVGVLLDALAQENLVTTLAEPNLTTTSGQPASFLAGGEFPVPVASSVTNGVATITVDFKKFGVSLDVTPTVIDPRHVSMRIRTGVSQLTSNGAVTLNNFTIPALAESTAETTVELGSGQSFLLAGLMQNTATQNISKVPWLGDIPVLGQLFRSERFQHKQTELVILVTPYLVKPTLTSLAAPTDGFAPPHDAESIINGDTYRQKLPAPARGPLGPGGQQPVGLVGFRLD